MKRWVWVLLVAAFIFWGGAVSRADDLALFAVAPSPDGLFILDLSGSMNYPARDPLYIPDAASCTWGTTYTGRFSISSVPGYTYPCEIMEYFSSTNAWYGNSACSGDLYGTSSNPLGYTTPCRKIDIAKRTIAALLDDNTDGKWDFKDDNSLKVRLGYERFYNCIGSIGTPEVMVNIPNVCPSNPYQVTSSNAVYPVIKTQVDSESPYGGTSLVGAMDVAMAYLDTHKAADCAKECRKKFVILITDGEDTNSCDGSGGSDEYMYKRRRGSVNKARALRDAGYKVFSVGFGAMPHFMKNTMEWMAYHGGTDNPLIANTEPTQIYNPSSYTDPCLDTTTPVEHTLPGENPHYYSTVDDPGEMTLDGYAYFATDATQLAKALKSITKTILEEAYSFTAPTIPSVRVIDKDIVYVSSFIPNDTLVWQGNLKAYQLNADGTLPVDAAGRPLNANLVWDAGENLKVLDPGNRKIYTAISGVRKEFTSANVSKEDLAVIDDATRDKLINHVRGIDSYDLNGNLNTTEERGTKLGDIMHSNAVIVGSPSTFFEDEGYNGTGNFYENNKSRTKVIVVGANDGMLHAFNALTGDERWAFVPPSVLPTLKNNGLGDPAGDALGDAPLLLCGRVSEGFGCVVLQYGHGHDQGVGGVEDGADLRVAQGGQDLLCPGHHRHHEPAIPLGVPEGNRYDNACQGGAELVRPGHREGEGGGLRGAL